MTTTNSPTNAFAALTCRKAHDTAMNIAQDEVMLIQQSGGEPAEVDRLRALVYELLAVILLLEQDPTVQPSRRILLRSASALALDCHASLDQGVLATLVQLARRDVGEPIERAREATLLAEIEQMAQQRCWKS